MGYVGQSLRDVYECQRYGCQALESGLEPEEARLLRRSQGLRLGVVSLGATTINSLAHGAVRVAELSPEAAALRRKVANDAVILTAVFNTADEIVDARSDATARDRAVFIDRVRSAILTSTFPKPVDNLPDHDLQRAVFAASRLAYRCLGLSNDVRRAKAGMILQNLRHQILAQPESTDPGELLDIGQRTFGHCLEILFLPTQFADGEYYSRVSRAAWQIGRYCGPLDHGSEVVGDLRDGTRTFATQLIKTDGPSYRTIARIREMREDNASDAYRQGIQNLETAEQRELYRTLWRLVRTHYALQRLDLNAVELADRAYKGAGRKLLRVMGVSTKDLEA
ncbi:MAG TPA: hypothetical protein VGS28_00450 [Candidatus Saccharimonadales bacterium]|nr:hypothetical protein [Candidatus Saccharimonadales bacterium]